jgi:hypothetical protein
MKVFVTLGIFDGPPVKLTAQGDNADTPVLTERSRPTPAARSKCRRGASRKRTILHMINFCSPGPGITARKALKNVLQSRRVYQSSGRRFFYSPRRDRARLRYLRSPRQPSGPGAGRADRRPDRLRPVSTSGQLPDRQQHALTQAGCLRVFADKLSGKDAGRNRGAVTQQGPRQHRRHARPRRGEHGEELITSA